MMKFSNLFLFLFLVHFLNGQIVINEVMVNPQTNSLNSQFQSLKMCSQPTYGSEYIELYNPTGCAVDISCYLIGFNTNFVTGINGTFRFPAGTIVPGNGFLSIGGPNSGATINLFSVCASVNLNTDADRWYIPNGDGYLMLWDATGTAIDAVYWTINSNEPNKWGVDSDISVAPTFVAQGNNCSTVSTLNGPAQIPSSSSIVFYAGQSPSIGTVIHRIVDGGLSWSTNASPTINACNGVCNPSTSTFQLNATITQPTCGNSDGVITFNPSPSDTYFYNWPFPTTGTVSSSTNLAAGSYQISITNLAGCSVDTTVVLIEDCQGCGLVATVSVIPNSVCEPCFYSGPPILINELMISPSVNDGSISGPGPAGGRGEWIELYNPDLCDSVDISCYYLGNSTSEGSGGFRLPTGTIIPPNGFCMVRGVNVDPVPSNLLVQNGGNVVEVIVPGEVNQTGICCTGTRVWFPNAGGWFAFYDANGNPVDAVRWGPGNTASLAGQPCISSLPGCSIGASLLSYNDIPTNLKFYASPADGGTHFGQTIRRMPDGGSWAGIGQPTYSICNDVQNCLTGSLVGYCNGQGTVNVNTGQAPFNYQWNDPLLQNTQTATNLCEGTYEVVVTDANNCQETYTVNVITNPFNLSTIVQNPGCQQSNGSITIDPFDPNYSYTWLPNVSTSNSAFNLPQGTYTISISQGFCSLDTVIVLQNPIPFSVSAQSVQTTCGENNGSIFFNLTPAGNYVYSWFPNVSVADSASNLAAGSYQISITDNVCAFDTTITILPSVGLTSASTVYNSTCQLSNGAIAIDVFPIGTYTYTWPTGINSTIDSAANLPAGPYLVSFTDGICTNDTLITVSTTNAPTDIIANITATQCDENTGEIAVVSTIGGIAPYTYALGNGAYSPNIVFDSLAQGSYIITVLDNNNCSYQETISVPIFAGPSLIQASQINPNCGLSNGSLVINGTIGGSAPYQYLINNSSILSGDTLSNLSLGQYVISVTDANGCTLTQNENLVMTAGIPSIFIPNVLTANDDETNDIWKINTKCVENIECLILNRWGAVIYEFNEITGGWDGRTTGGVEAVSGVYFYRLTINDYGGDSEVFHGHITLIR
jgi:gliding motility-associated-like protein